MFKSIEQIKEASEALGHYFFKKDTMRFFNSRIGKNVYKGKYFITSERFNSRAPRLYTIRKANNDGSIDTVGEFQQYNSSASARYHIEQHLN